MTKKHIILLLLPFIFCSLFQSCDSIPSNLQLVEKLMDTKPDSALKILKKTDTNQYKSNHYKALYGILLFQTLDKNNKPLQPDSVLNYSISYYQQSNETERLAIGYYYKARLYKKIQRFDEATIFYLKSLDILRYTTENYFLGKIYSDMADICAFQNDYKEALFKYQLSSNYFTKVKDSIEICNKLIDLGRIYRLLENPRKAQLNYNKAISQTTDSMVFGAAYQEIGINYFYLRKYDSAKKILKKSLNYPFRGTSYSIRCYIIADAYFETNNLDSAIYYSKLAFKYPSTFFVNRECYRILANAEYRKGHLIKAEAYINNYQDCTDSVRKIEIQTKTTVLEDLHDKTQETTGTKRYLLVVVSMSIVILLIAAILVFILYRRNQQKKRKLTTFKQELKNKQEFVHQNLSKKIKETREIQAAIRKNASPEERIKLDKELYEKCLHINNWDAFACEMNHALNQVVHVLQTDYNGITQKEIIWCCLELLNIPQADKILLLGGTSDSIYKLKQRLAQKMNLESTKELNLFLKNFTTAND